ncbi:MAG: carbohydrate ABC transporter permease [Firmicutes bacterium]|nr:carbohydrate ABC transporter permease [Bacillota bacterium]
MKEETLKGKLWTVHISKRDSNHKIGRYILSIILALFGFIQLYPLIWLVLFSLKDNSEIFGGNIVGLPEKFLWQNYSSALFNGNVMHYFLNSVIVTFSTIAISGLLACMASYAIARMKWKLSKTVLIFFLLGLMIPIHAALLPLFLILRDLKLLNSYWALIIPYVAFALPMAIFILTGFFQTIPKEMEESACIDGCSIYRTFYAIMLPLVKPAIATISIFTYLSAWNELMFAITFISKQQFKTLTVGIMSLAGQYITEWGPIGAGLVVSTLPTIIIYVLMSDQVQKSLTAGAVKG